jgi:hypothetical protein
MERAAAMKIRMTKSFGAYRPGDVVEMPTAPATRLISDGYAVEERQRNLIETASVEERSETADVNPRRKS